MQRRQCFLISAIFIQSVIFGFVPCVLGNDKAKAAALDGSIRELRTLESVTGSAVGDGAEPGEFYLLSKKLLALADPATFRKLTTDPNAIVRAMGLYCLSQTDPAAAIPMLRERLLSRDGFLCFPGGCMGFRITEGNFAWHLLCDSQFLEFGSTPHPLLADSDRVAMNLKLLAADQSWAFHYEIVSALDEFVRAWPKPLTLPVLQRAAPTLSVDQIIKAVGRMKRDDSTESFLIDCMRDSNLPPNARFAAASALSDSPSAAILRAKESLDALDQRHWGSQIANTMESRSRFEAAFRPVRDARTAEAVKKLVPEAMAVFQFDDPFAFPDLAAQSTTWWVAENPKLTRVAAESMVRLAERLPETTPRWNQSRDVIYRFDDFLRPNDDPDFDNTKHLRSALGPERWSALQAKVKAVLRTCDAAEGPSN